MKDTQDRDAHESGCGGLKEGWAYIKASGKSIHASAARKKDGLRSVVNSGHQIFHAASCFS
jgi:hypothetical protein